VIDANWEFEWQNFVYGCLAGLGAMIILIIMFQIVFYKDKRKRKEYDFEMEMRE